EQAEYRQGQSLRGGVPVCWPWFGDLKRNPPAVQAMHDGSAPPGAHGLVRTREWQLEDLEDAGDEVHMSLSLETDGLPGWPHAARLSLESRLGQRLQLSLTTENLGQQPMALSQALHTYLAVSDIRKVSVDGAQNCRYIETLENWQERSQRGALTFIGETDRIYLQTPPQLSIRDPLWQRQINLRAQGSQSAVVWNPWIDKAQRLTQFAPNAWRDMLCIETANLLQDAVHLAPGAQHRLRLELWSQPL